MVDLRAFGGIVSTLALTIAILHIVLSIALDWIHHPFGHNKSKKRK